MRRAMPEGRTVTAAAPKRFGPLPAQMAAVCAMNMPTYDLAVTSAVERPKEAGVHALLLDPLTATACTPAEIRQMTMALFEAEEGSYRGTSRHSSTGWMAPLGLDITPQGPAAYCARTSSTDRARL